MLLVCSACGARQPLGEGAEAVLASAHGVPLRCPDCGRAAAFLQAPPPGPTRASGVASLGPSPEAPPLADLEERNPAEMAGGWWGRALALRIEGEITHIEGLDPLRRMVIRGVASSSDLVSRDGVSWEPLAHIPELQPYLAVRQHLCRSTTSNGRGALADASSAADGWGGADDPTESVPRPGRSGDARRPRAAPDSSHGA